MLKKLLLLTLVSFLLLSIRCQAEETDYMRAEFTKSGYVVLTKIQASGIARFLDISLAIPQNTSNQETRIVSVDGPDSYRMSEDMWGNQILVLTWTGPGIGKSIHYEVVFDVRVYDREVKSPGKSYQETALVKPSPDITKRAYEISSGLKGIQKIFGLTEFVNSWLEYDEACTNFTQSAVWAFQNRRGTCDEFSNLLISMLRAVGNEAYYVVGYAYTEGWSAHGWVEVPFQGKTITIDPTWLESPVDVSHIKLATLSDSNFTESAVVRGSSINIDWVKDAPNIKTVGKKQTERFTIRPKLVPERVSGESDVLLVTEILTRIPSVCILDRIDASSCKDEGGEDFLELSDKSQTVSFCENQTLFWFLKSPRLEKGTVYTCPVLVYSGENEERVTLNLDSGHRKDIELYVNTVNILVPKENFTVNLNVKNSGSPEEIDLYLFFHERVIKQTHFIGRNEEKKIQFPLEAPLVPGEYGLRIFSSSGDSVSRKIRVIEKRFLQFTNVSYPSQSKLGEKVSIVTEIKNLDEKTDGMLQVRLGEETQERRFEIDSGEYMGFVFYFEPETPGKNDISIILLSEGIRYEDGWFGSMDVIKEESLFDSLVEWFKMVLGKITELLGLA